MPDPSPIRFISSVPTPALLLADEPTGNLDSTSTRDVLALFDRLHAAGRTIVLITHDDEVASRAQRVVVVTDGRLRAGASPAAVAPATASLPREQP